MKIIYQAEDGRTFENHEDCLEYENNVNKLKNGFTIFSVNAANYVRDEVTSKFWNFISNGDFLGATDFLLHDIVCDIIIFKNKDVLKNFLQIGDKYLFENISYKFDLDQIDAHYDEFEAITFYNLDCFPRLRLMYYGSENDCPNRPLFLDKENLENVINIATDCIKDWENNLKNF